MLSVRIWRTSRPLPAPKALRIASSFCRVVLRASNRLDRFAQTISITTPTANASTVSAGRSLPLTCSFSRLRCGVNPLRFGCSFEMCSPKMVASACALANRYARL